MNKNKSIKPIYVPPVAIDISSYNVHGQDQPLAICQDGNSPISFTCFDGIDPQQPESCSPTGLLPTYGRCSQGGNAVEGCFAGENVSDCNSGMNF